MSLAAHPDDPGALNELKSGVTFASGDIHLSMWDAAADDMVRCQPELLFPIF